MAFCVWDGGFLPTEAEAMYASSGGSLQRAFPWSSPAYATDIDCSQANYAGCLPAAIHEVGSLSPAGDGVWEHADLAGNVWEWALDWEIDPFPMPCTDCATLTEGSYRIIRGGSFYNVEGFLRAARRGYDSPEIGYDNSGLRCARAP